MPFIQNIFFTNSLLIQNKIQHKNLTFMYNRVNYQLSNNSIIKERALVPLLAMREITIPLNP